MLEQHIDMFLMTKAKVEGRRPGTIKAYGREMHNADKAINKPLLEITTNDIKQYLFKRTCGDSTLCRTVAVLKSFFEYCEIEELIEKNPMRKIKARRIQKDSIKYLEPEEINQAKSVVRGKRDTALFEFLLGTGLRVSELCAANREHLNLDEGFITVPDGKGGKFRVVFVLPEAIEPMREYLASRTDSNQALFITQYGQRMTSRGVQYTVAGWRKKSGLKKALTPHKFRHTHLTNLLREGVPINILQTQAGHSSIATTRIYAKETHEDVKRVILQLHNKKEDLHGTN